MGDTEMDATFARILLVAVQFGLFGSWLIALAIA